MRMRLHALNPISQRHVISAAMALLSACASSTSTLQNTSGGDGGAGSRGSDGSSQGVPSRPDGGAAYDANPDVAGQPGSSGFIDAGSDDSGQIAPARPDGAGQPESGSSVDAGWHTCDGGPTSLPRGQVGAWEQLTLPGLVPGLGLSMGDRCQSIVVDPVNPGTLITGCGANDGRKIKWYRTGDYGDTWTLVNGTAMGGNPWGFSIDPNPRRPCATPLTLYSPAGYGSDGAWKSTDGASTWTRSAGADSAFANYNPFGTMLTDLYHVAVLPDDPPNHVLATYHYSFKNYPDGGLGETWDGGQTWVIHPPPAGFGTSHYVLPISATTWCVIAQSNLGQNGIWRTTTAGRTGGTAANKYRDGTISVSAWTKVASVEHIHGSYAWAKVGNVWYSPGDGSSGVTPTPNGSSGPWKSIDDGATWQPLVPDGYWPSPPNPKYTGKNVSGLVATASYLYSNWLHGPGIARAPVSNDTNWQIDYTTTPAGLRGTGAEPFGNAATRHVASGKWIVFMTTYDNGVWRYIEP
jgi:hypothetical protein